MWRTDMSNMTTNDLNITIDMDNERGGMYVAHCLEFDIVVTAKTLHEVKNKMRSLLVTHLEYALENNINPSSSTPQAYWDKIMIGKYEPSGTIEISLRARKEGTQYALREFCLA
jgi:hypothetical protein